MDDSKFARTTDEDDYPASGLGDQHPSITPSDTKWAFKYQEPPVSSEAQAVQSTVDKR